MNALITQRPKQLQFEDFGSFGVSKVQLMPTTNPLAEIAEDDVSTIEDLVVQTGLPWREIEPGERHPYAALLYLRPVIERGEGALINSPEFLYFLADAGIEKYWEQATFHPEDKVAGMVDYVSAHRILPSRLRDPEADKACAFLGNVLESCGEVFKGKNVCGLLYGSQYFGDPSDQPDIDFDLITATSKIRRNLHPVALCRKINWGIFAGGKYGAHTGIINMREFHIAIERAINNDLRGIRSIHDFLPLLAGQIIDLPGANHRTMTAKVDECRDLLINAAEENPLFNLYACAELRGIVDRDMDAKPRAVRIALKAQVIPSA